MRPPRGRLRACPGGRRRRDRGGRAGRRHGSVSTSSGGSRRLGRLGPDRQRVRSSSMPCSKVTEGCTFDRDLLAAAGAVDEVVVLPTGAAYENPGKLIGRANDWFDELGVRVVEAPRADPARRARHRHRRGRRGRPGSSISPGPTPCTCGRCSRTRRCSRRCWAPGAAAPCWPARRPGPTCCATRWSTPGAGPSPSGLGVVPNLAIIPHSNTWSHEKIHRTVELVPKGITLAAVPEATALIRAPAVTGRSAASARSTCTSPAGRPRWPTSPT